MYIVITQFHTKQEINVVQYYLWARIAQSVERLSYRLHNQGMWVHFLAESTRNLLLSSV
jgi:hypothetical protein